MYDWNSNTVAVSIPVHRQLDTVYPVYPCITAGTTGIIGCARLRSQIGLRVFELERLIALIA